MRARRPRHRIAKKRPVTSGGACRPERRNGHRSRHIISSSPPSCSRSGFAGIILNRKNIIVILMSVELILLSVNINLVAFSAFLHDLTGQVFALFILTVAAAEAAIGLAILVTYFRNRGSIAVEDINMMKG